MYFYKFVAKLVNIIDERERICYQSTPKKFGLIIFQNNCAANIAIQLLAFEINLIIQVSINEAFRAFHQFLFQI